MLDLGVDYNQDTTTRVEEVIEDSKDKEVEEDYNSSSVYDKEVGVIAITLYNTKTTIKKYNIAFIKRQLEQQSSLRLIALNTKVLTIKRAAYQSIIQQDKYIILQIFMQPIREYNFFKIVRTPYYTILFIVEKARKLGNITSYIYASLFLSTQQVNRSPLLNLSISKVNSSIVILRSQ